MRTSEPERVLVVEDDRRLGVLLRTELSELGLDVRAVGSVASAREMATSWHPNLVVSDLRLPDGDGMDLLESLRRDYGEASPGVILITAFGSIAQAVDALQRGADDFLTKPLDLDHLRIRAQRLLEVQRLKREVALHRSPERRERFHGMIGNSSEMRTLYSRIEKIAHGQAAVTITGPSGAGKELVARALHRESERSAGPYVAINCASIPEQLVESELFGHEPGAFTGATHARRGLFAEASGGTILLDEVAEIPGPLQAKLLRVVQDGIVRPVGSNQGQETDVRILVATHRDLEAEVAEGRFREDLYFRLSAFVLNVPSLRERGEDMKLLLAHFFDLHRTRTNKTLKGFTPDALHTLEAYPFPGNVRELENAVEYAVTLCQAPWITAEDLPDRIRSAEAALPSGQKERLAQAGPPPVPMLGASETPSLEELAIRYVQHTMHLTGGNKRRTAALLGISRQTLYRYLRKSSP